MKFVWLKFHNKNVDLTVINIGNNVDSITPLMKNKTYKYNNI